MAENKKSFVAYCDWGETFDELTDVEAGKLVKHLFDYVRDKAPNSDKQTNLLFIPIKQSLKRDLIKYEQYIDKQRVNGSKGGRPKKPKETQKTQRLNSKPKKADSVNVSVNDNVSDINKIKDIPFFKDFKDYALEKSERLKFDLDLIKLELKYESWIENNWKDGNDVPIKNWKSKVSNTIPYLKKEKGSLKKEKPKTIDEEFAHLTKQ